MKLPWIIGAGIAIVAAGMAIYLLSQNSNQPVLESTASPAASLSVNPTGEPSLATATATATATTPAATSGAYINYSGTVIASTAGTKILFFHAPWCPQCRALEADIKANAIPSGVTIIKTDYDTNQDLRKKYGVTIQTTLVRVDDAGDIVKKYVAYDSPTLAAVIAHLL